MTNKTNKQDKANVDLPSSSQNHANRSIPPQLLEFLSGRRNDSISSNPKVKAITAALALSSLPSVISPSDAKAPYTQNRFVNGNNGTNTSSSSTSDDNSSSAIPTSGQVIQPQVDASSSTSSTAATHLRLMLSHIAATLSRLDPILTRIDSKTTSLLESKDQLRNNWEQSERKREKELQILLQEHQGSLIPSLQNSLESSLSGLTSDKFDQLEQTIVRGAASTKSKMDELEKEIMATASRVTEIQTNQDSLLPILKTLELIPDQLLLLGSQQTNILERIEALPTLKDLVDLMEKSEYRCKDRENIGSNILEESNSSGKRRREDESDSHRRHQTPPTSSILTKDQQRVPRENHFAFNPQCEESEKQPDPPASQRPQQQPSSSSTRHEAVHQEPIPLSPFRAPLPFSKQNGTSKSVCQDDQSQTSSVPSFQRSGRVKKDLPSRQIGPLERASFQLGGDGKVQSSRMNTTSSLLLKEDKKGKKKKRKLLLEADDEEVDG